MRRLVGGVEPRGAAGCARAHDRGLPASEAFWAAAGFEVERIGDDFSIAECDGVELHLTQSQPEGRDRGQMYLHARDVDALHDALAAAGLVLGAVADEPWGMREFNVVDPGGNRVRVGRST